MFSLNYVLWSLDLSIISLVLFWMIEHMEFSSSEEVSSLIDCYMS